jgi:hypothetical protein
MASVAFAAPKRENPIVTIFDKTIEKVITIVFTPMILISS